MKSETAQPLISGLPARQLHITENFTLIDDEDVRVRVGCQRFLEACTIAGVREVLDEFCHGGEKSLEAVLDSAVANGHRQMGLPSAGLSVQDQRPPLGDEVQPEVGSDMDATSG